jgi:urease accessory protein
VSGRVVGDRPASDPGSTAPSAGRWSAPGPARSAATTCAWTSTSDRVRRCACVPSPRPSPLPARSGARSLFTVNATVAAGGLLRWLPEQTVAAAGCRHTTLATLDLQDGASLLWRDELICGRADEHPGDVTTCLSVTYAGRPLLRQTLHIGPDATGWSGPAVLGGATAAVRCSTSAPARAHHPPRSSPPPRYGCRSPAPPPSPQPPRPTPTPPAATSHPRPVGDRHGVASGRLDRLG